MKEKTRFIIVLKTSLVKWYSLDAFFNTWTPQKLNASNYITLENALDCAQSVIDKLKKDGPNYAWEIWVEDENGNKYFVPAVTKVE